MHGDHQHDFVSLLLDEAKLRLRMNAMKVLLVDDDAHVRMLLRERLESAGYQVVEASGGEAALRLYQDAPTDVVIADMVMPGMGGRELIGELQRVPDVKIVAISGAPELDVPELLGEAQRLGAIRTLAKPFTSAQLLEAVEAVVGHRACR